MCWQRLLTLLSLAPFSGSAAASPILTKDMLLVQARPSLQSPAAAQRALACGPAGWCPAGMPVDHGELVFLTSHTMRRLGVNDTSLDASGKHRERWELFTLLKAGGGGSDISSGDEVLLKAHTGHFVSVHSTTVAAPRAVEGGRGPRETFVLTRREGSGRLRVGDDISLAAHTGRRLSVTAGGQVVATSGGEEEGHEEAFTIHKVIPPWQLPRTGGALEAVPGDVTTTTSTTQMLLPPSEVNLRPRPRRASSSSSASRGAGGGPRWTSTPVGDCELRLGCHRPVQVTCRDEKGQATPDATCLHAAVGRKPKALEKCLVLGTGRGSCANIAVSDCKDVAGDWWNRWGMTCSELRDAGACRGGPPAELKLAGWLEASDLRAVRETCRVSCPATECVRGPASPVTRGAAVS